MAGYRLTHAARADIISILAWSHEQFGEEARKRYEALIAAAIRAAASRDDDGGHTPRPELGEGIFSWHLSNSRARAPGGKVHRPRHFLICRRDGDTLVIVECSTTPWTCDDTSTHGGLGIKTTIPVDHGRTGPSSPLGQESPRVWVA